MCSRAGRSSPSGLLFALLAAALLATAISQETIDIQQQEQQQQPEIAGVDAYKLTQIPGCAVAEGDGYELPAGACISQGQGQQSWDNSEGAGSPLSHADPTEM